MIICASDIKKIINVYMPKQTWVHISDIQALIQRHYRLSKQDEMPHTYTRITNYPIWKKRIQCVLSNLKANGSIQHDPQNNTYLIR